MDWSQLLILILLMPYLAIASLWLLIRYMKIKSPELFAEKDEEPAEETFQTCSNCGYDEFDQLRHGRVQCLKCGWTQRTSDRVIHVE